MIDTTTEYVYDGTLVKLTGRVAKKIQAGTDANRRRTRESSASSLVEITPAELSAWTKWVPMTDLYEIVNNTQQSPEEHEEDYE